MAFKLVIFVLKKRAYTDLFENHHLFFKNYLLTIDCHQVLKLRSFFIFIINKKTCDPYFIVYFSF